MARTLQTAIRCAALALMVGCVSDPPVVQLGADTYSASSSADHRSGAEGALNRAELKAEAFCSARHQSIEDTHTQTAETTFGWQAEVQFHCIHPAGVVSDQTPAAGSTQAGPLLTLFNEPAETITAVADRSGLVHVFAETTVAMSLIGLFGSSPVRAIHHFTVALDGSLQHEVVETSNRDVWGNLTAVFDAGGRLHLIFGRRHIVLGSDGWHSAPDAPRCTLLALSGSQSSTR